MWFELIEQSVVDEAFATKNRKRATTCYWNLPPLTTSCNINWNKCFYDYPKKWKVYVARLTDFFLRPDLVSLHTGPAKF
jgi:hypothetical protein